MEALAMFFVKLGRSPWEKRFASLCGLLLKIIGTGAALWMLLNLDTLIPMLLKPSTLVL